MSTDRQEMLDTVCGIAVEAGQAILEAAGGRVETLAGDRLAYGKPGFKNDGFLAWGRPA